MECTFYPANPAQAVTDCFGVTVAGLDLGHLGKELRDLVDVLPRIDSDSDKNEIDRDAFEGEITLVAAELRGLSAEPPLPGDGRSPGQIRLDFSLNNLAIGVHVTELDLGEPIGDLASTCGGSFDLFAFVDEPGAMHLLVSGPPAFAPRAESARFGMPIVPRPVGRGSVDASDIRAVPAGSAPCTDAILAAQLKTEAELARALRGSTPDLGGGINAALFGPMLQDSLVVGQPFPPPPATQFHGHRGIVLFVNESGELTSVFEKP